jgi:hypothetical protein
MGEMSQNLLKSAKDIGIYVLVTLGTYFIAIVSVIVLGFLKEKVVGSLGLNASGTAVTQIGTFITATYTAITAITAVVTVVTGLLTLSVVLQVFGFDFKFNMGQGRV